MFFFCAVPWGEKKKGQKFLRYLSDFLSDSVDFFSRRYSKVWSFFWSYFWGVQALVTLIFHAFFVFRPLKKRPRWPQNWKFHHVKLSPKPWHYRYRGYIFGTVNSMIERHYFIAACFFFPLNNVFFYNGIFLLRRNFRTWRKMKKFEPNCFPTSTILFFQNSKLVIFGWKEKQHCFPLCLCFLRSEKKKKLLCLKNKVQKEPNEQITPLGKKWQFFGQGRNQNLVFYCLFVIIILLPTFF